MARATPVTAEEPQVPETPADPFKVPGGAPVGTHEAVREDF